MLLARKVWLNRKKTWNSLNHTHPEKILNFLYGLEQNFPVLLISYYVTSGCCLIIEPIAFVYASPDYSHRTMQINDMNYGLFFNYVYIFWVSLFYVFKFWIWNPKFIDKLTIDLQHFSSKIFLLQEDQFHDPVMKKGRLATKFTKSVKFL